MENYPFKLKKNKRSRPLNTLTQKWRDKVLAEWRERTRRVAQEVATNLENSKYAKDVKPSTICENLSIFYIGINDAKKNEVIHFILQHPELKTYPVGYRGYQPPAHTEKGKGLKNG